MEKLTELNKEAEELHRQTILTRLKRKAEEQYEQIEPCDGNSWEQCLMYYPTIEKWYLYFNYSSNTTKIVSN